MRTKRHADLVLSGPTVFSASVPRDEPVGIAVRDGRIAALARVGSGEDLRDLIGPSTRVIPLTGRMVVPGFQDAHVHPPHGGLNMMRCALFDVSTQAGYLDAIASYAAANPDLPWILGGGWRMDAFPHGIPDRRSLDAVVADRPVFLVNRDGHGAWVNSRALEMARITRDTPDPRHGRIERDHEGDPGGALQEGAMDLVNRIVPPPSQADLEEAIRRAQRHLHSLGVTAWQDAWVEPAALAAYRTLAERGELTAHVVAGLWWEREQGEEQIADLLERRGWATLGRLVAGTVKIMQDGVCENFTAAMLQPYLDTGGRSMGGRGMSFVEPSLLRRAVTRLDREGFQVHFHAIGDRAVREALDALEAARAANGLRDARHHIAHIQVIHPDDLPRFARLGVVANGQPYWASHEPQMDDLTLPFLGPKRSAWQYPFASLLRSGARLAFGSDWTVSTANPLLEMEVAVNRVAPETRDLEPLFPEERIPFEDALTAFTAGSAFVNRLDAETGTIEVGKHADLAVIDRNLFAKRAGPIGDAKVLLTLVEGQAVFEDEELEG